MEIDFKKLIKNVESCTELQQEAEDTRYLLEITSKEVLNENDLEFIKNAKVRIFTNVYRELDKKYPSDMKILNDMVIGEYAKDNLDNAKYCIDEDEEDDIY